MTLFIGDGGGGHGCLKDVVVISSDSCGEVEVDSLQRAVKDEGTTEGSVIVTSYKLLSFWSYTHRHTYTHIIYII